MSDNAENFWLHDQDNILKSPKPDDIQFFVKKK